MRITFTSDLHYNVARSSAPTRDLAKAICRAGGDALVFVGDSAASDLAILDEVFGLFEAFDGPRLAVAGNHELWMPRHGGNGNGNGKGRGDTNGNGNTNGHDSMHRYEHELSAACARSGVHYLDASPFYLDDVALVGSVGWYDYSFRTNAVGVPLRFYQRKVAPGAAAYYEEHRDLVDGYDDVTGPAREITCRWMDGVHVRLPMDDVAFTHYLAEKLRRHLAEASARAKRVVAAVHHLPFADLVPPSIIPNWAFAAAFLGSELLGEVLLDCPAVTHAFCGHSHRSRRCRRGGLVCQSIGSTYSAKAYEVLDV
jgi:hypothetical protein